MRAILVLLLLGLQSLVMAQHVDGTVRKSRQKAWVRETVRELKRLDLADGFTAVRASVVDIPDMQQVSFRVQGVTRISCGEGWVMIKAHSAHDNERVGDVCVGLTDRGKVYVNYGHICGGIVNFISRDTLLPASPEDFFRRFVSDTDEKSWKPNF